MTVKNILLITFVNLFFVSPIFAAERIVNLVVGYKTVYFAGKPKRAIAVNNQIPAPTLHFNEGDHVTINVYNRLDEETAIHWHGLLVPWQMDGVLGVTQQGIQPGQHFNYQFTLKQAGTYWYHAHAGLQEQQGLYGGFIIDPPQSSPYNYTKDYVVVLSDWTNTNPEQVFLNLKKDGDYYSPRFPLQASLTKFIHDYRKADSEERKKLIEDYEMMQQMRMSIYDINDVAYDAFLLNGHPKSNPWTALVKVGDIVRLRFIGAGGETIFHVKIPGVSTEMVHIQGNDVKPYPVNSFTVAPGETYDILVKIKKNEPYIIYAESVDTVGAALGALVTSPDQFVNYQAVAPFKEPLPVTREMMANMMAGMNHASMQHDMNMPGMNHHSMKMETDSKKEEKNNSSHAMHSDHQSMQMNSNVSHHMNSMSQESMESKHANHAAASDSMKTQAIANTNLSMPMNHAMGMPTEPSMIGDKLIPSSMDQAAITETKTIGTKYQNLKAAIPTNDVNKPVKDVIRMELFGYMNHFIWMINGLPEYKAKPIPLEPNKRYRLIFTNNSMMHHPMHIHGHWFILRNGHGTYDPLLHTIDVPPGSTVVVDVDTDASGQWFFHCHMLYHMMAGMARTFQYSTLIEITKGEAKPEHIVKNGNYVNRPIVRVDEARPIDLTLVKHPQGHHQGLYLASFLDIGEDPFHNVQELTFKGLYGSDYNKLELLTEDAELNKGKVENADIDIFYWRLISQFWAVKGGVNYFYRPATVPYWQPGIGIEGLMPYFIDTNARGYYYSGSAKLDVELSRDTQITNNFFIRLGIRSILASKTVSRAEIGSGLNQMRYTLRPYYRIMPGVNIFTEFEHDQDYGTFKDMQSSEGESTSENTFTFGLSVLF